MTRLAPMVAVALVAASLTANGQAPVFSSKVEAVRVDVLVTKGGKPVGGLTPKDFEIIDNGVRQQVDLVSFERLPLNVILALDMSYSVIGERLTNLRRGADALLKGLNADDKSALVTFNDAVTLRAGPTADAARIRAALDRMTPAGNTSVVDASFASIVLGESDVGRPLVIVFSDGGDTSSWLKPADVLEIGKRTDAVVYAIATGRGPQLDFLNDLTDTTGGRLFEIESTKNLEATFLGVLEEFRQRYVVSYSPEGVSRDGWHRLAVRVTTGDVKVKARPGYLAGR